MDFYYSARIFEIAVIYNPTPPPSLVDRYTQVLYVKKIILSSKPRFVFTLIGTDSIKYQQLHALH